MWTHPEDLQNKSTKFDRVDVHTEQKKYSSNITIPKLFI